VKQIDQNLSLALLKVMVKHLELSIKSMNVTYDLSIYVPSLYSVI